jgi:TRAP-type C4-dicarboxylate transport system permease small subunit
MASRIESVLRRFNEGIARGEAALAMSMLLLMLVVAFAQALLRNLTNVGVLWANVALGWLDWADFILTKGTLWLAFLGASLGVYSDKHVAIDIVPRFVSPRARLILRGFVGLIGSVICFTAARAFWSAVLINGEETSAAFEMLTPEGVVHVCDLTPAQLAEMPGTEPGPYCGIRSIFKGLGVTMETPGAAFQLIVPIMFVFMSVRMIVGGIYNFMRFARGDVADDMAAHGITAPAAEVASKLGGHGEKD